jgi:hypothetical protein
MRRPGKEKRGNEKNGMVATVIAGIVLVLLATGIPAYAKEGFFLSLQIPYNKVQGDFDDINAPSVDAGAGLGFIAGYGLKMRPFSPFSLPASAHSPLGMTTQRSAARGTISASAWICIPRRSCPGASR